MAVLVQVLSMMRHAFSIANWDTRLLEDHRDALVWRTQSGVELNLSVRVLKKLFSEIIKLNLHPNCFRLFEMTIFHTQNYSRASIYRLKQYER